MTETNQEKNDELPGTSKKEEARGKEEKDKGSGEISETSEKTEGDGKSAKEGAIKEEPTREGERDETKAISRKRPLEENIVAEHYNARTMDADAAERHKSEIFVVRKFNNWVKSVLISLACDGRPRLKVLDLGCGRGGDIGKWNKQRIRWLTGVDIAQVSLNEASERLIDTRPPKFEAEWICANCYEHPIDRLLTREKGFPSSHCRTH